MPERRTIYAHPCFKEQYDELIQSVEALKVKLPDTDQKKADTTILAHLLRSIANITRDPRSPKFRPGNGRYRLFFRYHFSQKIIVLAWVNDDSTLRTYGSKTDAYKVFGEMLKNGNPPDDWDVLLKAAK